MGCRKLTYYETLTEPLKVVQGKGLESEKVVQGFISVDPWADKYPHVTPYNFVENNPIMLIDPDGNGPNFIDFSGLWRGAAKLWDSAKNLFTKSDPPQDPEPALRTEDFLLEPVDVVASPTDWGGDNSGLIQSAPEGMHETDPVQAFLLDLSAWGLNNMYPAGALDDAGVVAQDENATVQDQVNAAVNVVMAGGARGKGGRYVPRGANGKPIRTVKTKAGNTKIDPEARGSTHTQLRMDESGNYPQRTTFDSRGRKRADTHFTTHGEQGKSNPHKHTYYKHGRRAR